MPVITPQQAQRFYDVIVIGSGAAGGQAAYTLTMEGLKVLMLEAGRSYEPVKETPMFDHLSTAPLRGMNTLDKADSGGFFSASINGGDNLPGEPYTNRSLDPAHRMLWWRCRMLGGRTNHWARKSYRYSPADFRLKALSGVGLDWPFGYEELAPYYDKAEMLMGVYGDTECTDEGYPKSSPGVLLPPPKPRAGELYIKKYAKKVGLQVVAAHRAVLTKRPDAERISKLLHPNNPKAQRIIAQDIAARSACFFATDCTRGCSVRANYQSTTVQIPPAMATGNLDLICGVMAQEITLAPDGRADGVIFVERNSGQQHRVRARAVVLAASSYESVRLLFNSGGNRFPQGIGNSTGMLGKYLNTNFRGGSMSCQIPIFENIPPHDEFGTSGHHVAIPWWQTKEQLAGKLDFPRSYYISFATGRTPTEIEGASLGQVERMTRGKYGRVLREEARRYYGTFVTFLVGGAMMPNKDCYCERDPEVKDQWGIPVLRFHWGLPSPEDLAMGAHATKWITALIDSCGGKKLSGSRPAYEGGAEGGGEVHRLDGTSAGVPMAGAKPWAKTERLATGAAALSSARLGGVGLGNHEQGGAILGSDPQESVVNRWCQTWDVKNIFIADGAVVGCNSGSNPTLNIIAMAWRTADRIVEEMRKGNL